jgi:hypothetical protein
LKEVIEKKILGELRSILSSTESESKVCAVLVVYTWVSKGLILRSHKSGYEMTVDFLRLLNSSSARVASLATEAFSTILVTDTDGLLTRSSFAKTSAVFKQRFFFYCKKPLLEGFELAKEGEFLGVYILESKHHHLVALSNIIKNIPNDILTPELTEVRSLSLIFLVISDSSTMRKLHRRKPKTLNPPYPPHASNLPHPRTYFNHRHYVSNAC